MLTKVFSIIRNKFVIAALGFTIWMLFFDRNDLASQIHYHSQLKELQAERDFYEQETAKVKKDLEELSSDSKKLQKFAREKYLMKKDNEDVYVIVNGDTNRK